MGHPSWLIRVAGPEFSNHPVDQVRRQVASLERRIHRVRGQIEGAIYFVLEFFVRHAVNVQGRLLLAIVVPLERPNNLFHIMKFIERLIQTGFNLSFRSVSGSEGLKQEPQTVVQEVSDRCAGSL